MAAKIEWILICSILSKISILGFARFGNRHPQRFSRLDLLHLGQLRKQRRDEMRGYTITLTNSEYDALKARIAKLEAVLRLALPITRENLPKSHDAYQALKWALANGEKR